MRSTMAVSSYWLVLLLALAQSCHHADAQLRDGEYRVIITTLGTAIHMNGEVLPVLLNSTSTFNLTCTIDSNVASFTPLMDASSVMVWSFNGIPQPLTNNAHGFTFLQGGNPNDGFGQGRLNSRLHLPPKLTSNLEGTYACSVPGVASPNRQSIFLRVVVPARVTSIPSDTNATVNTSVSFSCAATGDFPLALTWYRDGVQVLHSPNGSNTSVLAIAPLGRADGGNYTCRAENLNGTSQMSFSLTVQEPPDFGSAVAFPTLLSWTTTNATFSVLVPDFDGNSPVTHYTVTCVPRAAYNFAAARTGSSPSIVAITVTGLQPGAAYDCSFSAVNAIGPSTPTRTAPVRLDDSISGPPIINAVAASSTSVTITYAPPERNVRFGDTLSFVLDYQATDCNAPPLCLCTNYTCSLNGTMNISGGAGGVMVITGLRRYTNYTFSLRAVNRAGVGMLRDTPVRTNEDIAGPPSITVAIVSLLEISVSWNEPLEPNGAITGYQVVHSESSAPENRTVTDFNSPAARNLTVTADVEFTTFDVYVSAVSAAGVGNPIRVQASTGASPVIDTSVSMYTFEAFRPLSIPCTVTSGNPAPTSMWTSPTFAGFSQAGGPLLLDPVPLNYSGTFTCTATNRFATATHVITLIVIVPAQVNIRPVVVGTAVTGMALYALACTGTGFPFDPDSQLIWRQGGNILGGSLVSSVARGVTTAVRTVNVPGNAEYTCSVISPSRSDATINVPWVIPSVLFTASRAAIGAGQNATLACSATGSPHPTLEIRLGSTVVVLTSSPVLNGSRVEARAVVFGGGVYTCVAVNRAGRRNRTATIQGPEETSRIISAFSDTIFFVIFAGGGGVLLILLILLLCCCYRRRKGSQVKTYSVRDDVRTHPSREYFGGGHQRQHSNGPDQNVVYDNDTAMAAMNGGPVQQTQYDGDQYYADGQQPMQIRGPQTTFQPGGAMAQRQQQAETGELGMGEGKVYYDDDPGYYPAPDYHNGAAAGMNTYSDEPEDPSVTFRNEGASPGQEALPTFTARHGDHILTAL